MARLIRRYTGRMRINHWLVALLFLCAGLTGLAIFHPVFWFFTALFGGGPWTKILHPFFGLLMVLGFVFLFLQAWRDNFWHARDTQWLRSAPHLLRGDEEAMPEQEKYNAGQKGVFWLFTACLLVLLATGFVFWQPWFADYFSVPMRRVAVLLHALAAFVLILGVIVHIYAAIWVKGSVRAMTRGYVTAAWARRHHPLWYREMSGDR